MPPMPPPLTTQVVLAVLLAASVDVAEDMRQLYAVCDVLLDAGWLTLPEPAAFAESDLQQRLAQLQSTALCYVETKALLAGQPLPACPVGRPRASSGTGQACSGSSGRTLVGRFSHRRRVLRFVAGQHGQSAVLAAPQLGSCASSGRAWWLWAARYSQKKSQTTGCPATALDVRASRLQSRRFHCL